MKKILMSVGLIYALLLLVSVSAHAYPGGLLHGKPLKDDKGNLFYKITDGDLNTYEKLSIYNASDKFIYDFPQTVDIEAYQIKFNSAKGSNTEVLFMAVDEHGQKKKILIEAGKSNGKKVTLPSTIKQVLQVSISRSYGEIIDIYEFDVYGRINDTIPPEQVKNLRAKPGIESVELEWDANKDADLKGYYVYVNGNKTYLPAPATKYKISNLISGNPYSFKVSAVDMADNEGKFSNVVSAIPLSPPPEIPKGLVATSREKAVELNWKPNADKFLANYIVYVNGIKTAETKNTKFLHKTDVDRRNLYEVSAIDTSGFESKRAFAYGSPNIPVPPPPEAPKALTAKMSADLSEIVLTWQPNTDPNLKEYAVYQSIKGSQFRYIGKTDKATYKVTSIEGNTEYRYFVRALDTFGSESKDSNIATVTTPNRDTTSTTKPGADFLLVTWTEVPGAVAYEILYNSKVVATALAVPPYEFKLTAAHGYDPRLPFQNVQVRAKFANGSTGGTGSGGNGSGGSGTGGIGSQPDYGFKPSDIINAVMYILGSLASFILLWIIMKFAPQIIAVLKQAAIHVRKEWVK